VTKRSLFPIGDDGRAHAGTPGASEELFDPTGQPKKRPQGVKKASSRPGHPGQIPIPGVPEDFRMIAETTAKKRK
jgi:hypothetical protein